MKLALSSMIPMIDTFLADKLGIPVLELMRKSGKAVADAVRARVSDGSNIVVLAGKGNNGGDGYAAAVDLMDEYSVTVVDIFSAGQKSDEGKAFLALFEEKGGKIIPFTGLDGVKPFLDAAHCVVDAVFGIGFAGEMPEFLRALAVYVRALVGVHKIAIDVPLGVNPDNGSVSDYAISSTATVALSFIKPGIVSYPARSFVGDIIYCDLGIPRDKVLENFDLHHHLIEHDWARESLPQREENSNKGTFGKLLVITGSERYRGAAHLSLEAALRSGVGLVTYLGAHSVISELSVKYPEVIYKEQRIGDSLTDKEIDAICELSRSHSATLLGSGSDNTDGLGRLALALLASEGSPLILDADAINALSTMGEKGVLALKKSQRTVIITPHPLEFARLSMSDVATIQNHRLEVAERFAVENKIILVLKGAGTVIADSDEVYINAIASSALAKAGSGDVLSGVIAALVAQGKCTPTVAAALAVYIHALAAQRLASEFSAYGVTPSDLPKEIARTVSYLLSDDEELI